MQNGLRIHKSSRHLAKSGEQRAKSRRQRVFILNSMLYLLSSTLRYRFFLFAGIFPYLLGQTLAFNVRNSLDWHFFWWGFLGIFLVLVGVELFNEYFDAKTGGDRIFSPERPNIPDYFLPLALCSMLFAFFIGLYLSLRVGWPILLFSLLGFLGAYFYVGPPIKWAYRGLGELVIAICYGPFMLLGSFYLQTKSIEVVPFFVSLICGLSIFYLALLNEIPDYYQDKLVGKRTLVVKLGKAKAIKLLHLSLYCMFVLLGLGVAFKKFPLIAMVVFLMLPRLCKSLVSAQKKYENPKVFMPAINTGVVTYLLMIFSLGIGYLG